MSSSYRDTLQLPKTEFPMRGNLAKREPERLSYWASVDLYRRWCELASKRPHFVLHDGPPYANGAIHLGHAVNKILKDIVLKSKTLSGYFTPYVPGWDCHGLPIELNVEKRLKAAKKDPTANGFREVCREYAQQQIDLQREAFKRLGVIGDWEHPYVTMDRRFEANVVRALAGVVENGHLDYGYKPVHWCLSCGSALAEAEVEYKDKTSSAIDVAFHLCELEALTAKAGKAVQFSADATVILPIWTTTPWTLPANEAVAVHPKVTYILLEADKGRYFIVAEALLERTI